MGRDGLIKHQFGHRSFQICSLVTLHRHPRKIEVRLLQIQVLSGLFKIGFSLGQLFVDLRRSDLCQ